MPRFLLTTLALLLSLSQLQAVGEAATYFEIFVPPNNDAVNRHVALIITAIYDSTTFDIVDDDGDGDSDDSVSGMLMSGQSYVLYIKDNGINDDANSSGQSGAKQDGDFFIVSSSNLVFASQSTNSDWQHDWVPATNKSSRGNRFLIYSPPTSYSPRDLNVYAYQDSTVITIRQISTAKTTSTGYTQVDPQSNNILVQRMLHIGEDLIYHHTDGRDLLKSGETYVLESNKGVTVQYGALHKNAKDGGGYVPSANGSSSGELFYFTVHTQAAREQEIRIVSWDDSNAVKLDYFSGGSWKPIEAWDLDELTTGDWVSYTGNVNSVFRVSCEEGKKVSVFEANWLETGSPGTSDIASMVSSRDGTTAGKSFLVYMPPPGREVNVLNPKTGLKYDYATHAYLFSQDTTTVTVVDAYTKGNVINRTYTIIPGDYVDCFLTRAEWNSIYNGDGKSNSGPERPYLLITSDKAMSVFCTNFNDNWMSYFGTSQTQNFGLQGEVDKEKAEPGDLVQVSSQVVLPTGDSVSNTKVEIIIGDGAKVVSSVFMDETLEESYTGKAESIPNTGKTLVRFDSLPALNPNNSYTTETEVIMQGKYGNGSSIPDNSIVTIETVVSGTVDGSFQQASVASGVRNETRYYEPELFFELFDGSPIVADAFQNLSVAFGDYNNDGLQDIFFGGFHSGQPSLLYRNNGDFTFTKITEGKLVTDPGAVTGATWGDYNNDGDLDIFLTLDGSKCRLFTNQGDGTFSLVDDGEISRYIGSCYSPSWIDYDQDGFLDLFMTDYISNRPNVLFHNEGGTDFKKIRTDSLFSQTSYSIGAGWCDYDQDGDPDLYVPNGNGENNSLYRNEGGGRFTAITDLNVVTDSASSSGCSWGDYDNDGDFDLFVANGSGQDNFLFQNQGDGSFVKITEGAVVNDGGDSQGSVWADVNNDGFLDLFVSNSDERLQFLYLNNGDGTFSRDEIEPMSQGNGFGLGVAAGDLDNDGHLEVLVAKHFDHGNGIYLNEGTAGSWIQIRLQGGLSNKSAIGARVWVKANIGGVPTWQVRQIGGQSGGGPGGQSSLIAHFGLGDAPMIDSVLVEWPSGFRQFQKEVFTNQLYTIIEKLGVSISGTVYFDADSSCQQGAEERGIPNQKIAISPGNFFVLTDSMGDYEMDLFPGTYTLSLVPDDNWEQICPVAPETHTVEAVEGGGSPILAFESVLERTDCSESCDQEITSNTSSNLTIEAGEVVCLAAGISFTGRLTIQDDGMFVVCGNASPSGINYNGSGEGKIVVSESGTFAGSSLNLNRKDAVFANYGQATFSGNLNLNGQLENFGTLRCNSGNFNGESSVLNIGTLEILSSLNHNSTLTNYGELLVGGNLNNNGGASLAIYCRLEVGGNLQQNGDFLLVGYAEVDGSSQFNGGGDNNFEKGSKLKSFDLTVNTDLFGPNLAGASLEVENNTVINGGAVLFGYLDLCDQTGIETMNGSLATHATIDCSGTFDEENCDDGTIGRAFVSYDFGALGLCSVPELAISIGTTGLRRGFENDFVINVQNVSPVAATDVELEVDISEYLVVKRTSLAWSDSIPFGDRVKYRWTFDEIPALSNQSIVLTDSVLPETPFGVLQSTFAEVYAAEADCDPSNNEARSTDEVVGSFDPNDKQCVPAGVGRNHYILGTDTLNYKIRFQNVGNFMASLVIINDTLSELLDWSTFEVGPMSHDGYVVMGENGTLRWFFLDINLADSVSNEPESHGFVQFKIQLKPDLPHGTVLTNAASIQFDYNELIHTNVVTHTIADRETLEEEYLLELIVFPNPVTETSTIMVYSLEEGPLPVPLSTLQILDPAGREVKSYFDIRSDRVEVARDEFLSGVYILKGEDIHGNTYVGRMIIW